MTCTECNTTLIKTYVELEGGEYLRCWTCDCSDVEVLDAEELE